MVRFYRINPPESVFRIPRFMLEIMIEQLPALEALEAQQQAMIAMLPHTESSSRSRFFRHLRRLVRIFEPKPKPIKTIAYDPDAAAAYFAARGMKVVRHESEVH